MNLLSLPVSWYISIYLSIYLCICIYKYIYIYIFICLSNSFCMYICIYVSIYLSIYQSIYLFTFLSFLKFSVFDAHTFLLALFFHPAVCLCLEPITFYTKRNSASTRQFLYFFFHWLPTDILRSSELRKLKAKKDSYCFLISFFSTFVDVAVKFLLSKLWGRDEKVADPQSV